MLTLQELADIAARYETQPARAMRAAVAVKASETGEAVRVPLQPRAVPRRAPAPRPSIEHGEARRMMERNGETRAAWRRG